ncbi:ferric reductase [Nakamurella lactea]|uniref:ferric reductase n=1 Tax=Nakamurella lactea TaxID=459515 RepID=UPI0038996B0F
MSLVALVFLVVHIASALVDGYVGLNLLDVFVPFGADYSPLWIGFGAVAVDLLLAVGVSSLLRSRIPRPVWRGIHLTAYAMWPLAVLHTAFTAGGDMASLWMQLVVAANVVAVVAAALRWRRRDQHPDALARRAGDLRHLAGNVR